MKKKIIIISLIMTMLVILGGCTASARDIGSDKAKAIALEDAGVEESGISRLRVDREEDDGQFLYEIKFMATESGIEYDYEILASDGTVKKSETEDTKAMKEDAEATQKQTEYIDKTHELLGEQIVEIETELAKLKEEMSVAQEDEEERQELQREIEKKEMILEGLKAQKDNQDKFKSINGSQSVTVDMEEAVSMVLDRVEGAEEKDIKIKLDYDDGQYTYEGDVIYNQTEYEFEINAATGTFLEWSEERR